MPRLILAIAAIFLVATALVAPACRGSSATPTPTGEDVPELAVVWEAWGVLADVYVGDDAHGALDRDRVVRQALMSMMNEAGIESDALLEELGRVEEAPPPSVPEGLEDIWRLWRLLVEREPGFSREQVAQAGVRGLVRGLDDNFTQFLSATEYEQERAVLEGHYEGIGVIVTEAPNGVAVVSVFPGSPAELVGLTPGDVITHADGETLAGLPVEEVASRLKGPPETTVEVVVDRPREGDLTFTIVRGTIEVPTVDYGMLDDDIGLLWVQQFTANTPREVQDALRELQAAGAQALVLDLRGNPGGSLRAAVSVASEFLSEGLVLYEINRDGERRDHPVTEGGTALTEPLAVLVDGSTISGAEVVAGALQAHGRGLLFGTDTFGKGSVTTVRRLSDGSVIHVSSSRWYTPDGHAIHGEGIRPDVVVPLFLRDLVEQRDRPLLLGLEHLREELHGPSPDAGLEGDGMGTVEIPEPPGGPTEEWQGAVDLFNRALSLQFQGRLSEAVATYQRSIDTYPTAEAHTFMAWTYSWMGRLEDAIDEAKRAIDLDPEYGNPYNDIGLYLIALGRPDEAILWLEQATQAARYAEPHFPYLNLGRAWVLKDDWAAALDHFVTAWELRPEALDPGFPTGSLSRALPPTGSRIPASAARANAIRSALNAFAEAWQTYDAEAVRAWVAPLGSEHAEGILFHLAWAKYADAGLAISGVQPLHVDNEVAVARATVREGEQSRELHYLLVREGGQWKVVMALR